MSEIKHTEGNWKVDEDVNFITTKSGMIICQFFTKDEVTMGNNKANAKLIAQSPKRDRLLKIVDDMLSKGAGIPINGKLHQEIKDTLEATT